MGETTRKRVLLKVSGEMLAGPSAFGFHQETLVRVCEDIAAVVRGGCQVCLVVGGGNIFRGASGTVRGLTRGNADKIGMLATVMNALVLQDTLGSLGLAACALSGVAMPGVCQPFSQVAALSLLEEGCIPIFGGGVGNPFFTTDTAAVLRAVEMGCDALFKGTQVDGVYSADPEKDPGAVRYDRLTYREVLERELRVMDGTAIALAREHAMPVVVFSLQKEGAFSTVLRGGGCFTEVVS